MHTATQARVERGVNQKEAETFDAAGVRKRRTGKGNRARPVGPPLGGGAGPRSAFWHALLLPESRLHRCCRPHAGPWLWREYGDFFRGQLRPFQPLPFRDPDRLVRVFSSRGTPAYLPVSGEDYFDWESQNHSFEGISLYRCHKISTPAWPESPKQFPWSARRQISFR